jgi:WD40 repeat protein
MRLVKLTSMKRINGLHFTPDGRRLLAVGGAEVRMQDWAVWIDVGEMTETLRVPMHASCAAVSPDLTRIAVGNAAPFLRHNTDIPPVAVLDATDPTWHEDESRWRTVIDDGPNRLDVGGLAFDPTGERLAVSYSIEYTRRRSIEFVLVILPLGVGKAYRVPFGADHTRLHPVVAFSPDGDRLAVTGGLDDDPVVSVVNARTADPLFEVMPPGARTLHLAFSPGGTLAVTNAKTVHLMPADSDVPGFTLVHPKQANAVAFIPDGRRVLSTCHDGQLRIWDVATGHLVSSYDWGVGPTTAVAVSPDGLTAAAAGQKGRIAVLDLG